MKYLVALVAGIVSGAVLFALLLYLNPLASRSGVSPLAVAATGRLAEFSFPAVAGNAIGATGSGLFGNAQEPSRIAQFWEPAIEDTEMLVVPLTTSRGEPAGVGIKFASVAEEPGILNGIYPVHSVWQLWLPGRGGLMIDQTENRYGLLREVVLPARLSSASNWRGTWRGILTRGPNALRTGRVAGASGEFAGATGEAVETIVVRAWAGERGAVDAEGRITLSLPVVSP